MTIALTEASSLFLPPLLSTTKTAYAVFNKKLEKNITMAQKKGKKSEKIMNSFCLPNLINYIFY